MYILLLYILSCVLSISSESENNVLSVALCIARCLDVPCQSNCEQAAENNTVVPFTNITSKSNVSLQCRDVHRLVLKHDPGIFLIEYKSEENEKWQGPFTSTDTIYELTNLLPAKKYRFQLRRVLSDGIALPDTTDWFETNPVNYTPKVIENALVESFVASPKKQGQLETWLNILPANDRNCIYSVVHWGTDHNLFHYELDAKREYRLKLNHMKYDKENVVHIISRNKFGERDGKNYTLTFQTPSCLDLHLNLTVCPPAQVAGLKFTNSLAANGSVNLKVSWIEPELHPDNYTVILLPLDLENSNSTDIIVPGNESTANLYELVPSHRYKVGILAESLGGTSLKWEMISIPVNTKWGSGKTFPIVAATTALTSLAFFLVFAYILQKRKFKNTNCQYAFFKNITRRCSLDDVKSPLKSTESKLQELNDESNDNQYEIQAEQLLIKQQLGSGIGGIVKLASLRNHHNQTIPVAVKMLRENATPEERRDFYREISLMRSTGNHQNIVSLVGCCIFDKQPLLIVEYCSEGDLLTYLRNFFQEIVKVISRQVKCFRGASYNGSSCMTNNLLYDIQTAVDNRRLSAGDLLSFAQQVATGMEFLSLNRIIHRDLAARNVLVCADKTIKISDFGLSRDVYQENIYKKQSDGKLPLKWMAIEALTHQIYTTQSDVWSFGVLLYEIVTIGGNPYPGVQSNQVLSLLKTGYRMEKPSNCGIELYEIMQSCWNDNPTARPSFSQLKQYLDALSNTPSNCLNLCEILNEPMYYQRFLKEDTSDL